MIDFEYFKNKILDKYKEKNDEEMYERYTHVLNVAKFCGQLVDVHKLDVDKEKAILTGLLSPPIFTPFENVMTVSSFLLSRKYFES